MLSLIHILSSFSLLSLLPGLFFHYGSIRHRHRLTGGGYAAVTFLLQMCIRDRFYAPKKSLPLRETEGKVCSEFVMFYPPGIPILAPGERITRCV